MVAQPISLWRTGLYWTLALAIACLCASPVEAQTKATPAKSKKAKPTPEPKSALAAEYDPLTEWELVSGAANDLRVKLAKQPRNEALRQQLAELAMRSAVGAERALAIGDASLFDSYRRQFGEQFHDTRWRLGRMAELGNGSAEYAAGVVDLHGFLSAADVASACRHFDAALDKGYQGAKFRASQCLAKDEPARAAKLLREAAVSGHPAAAEIAGRACLEAKPPDTACAWDNLILAAAAGRPSAQSLLGWMYAQGYGGRPPDFPRAARLYQQGANAGDASAQNNVGELYETGRGVPADPKKAAQWYRRAAEAGFAPAQLNLGRLYATGSGVPKNYDEARRWLETAERGGIASARKVLEWMEKEKTVK